MKRKLQGDYWQLNTCSAIDGEERGILLYVCHPIMEIYNQVILWIEETNRGRNTP